MHRCLFYLLFTFNLLVINISHLLCLHFTWFLQVIYTVYISFDAYNLQVIYTVYISFDVNTVICILMYQIYFIIYVFVIKDLIHHVICMSTNVIDRNCTLLNPINAPENDSHNFSHFPEQTAGARYPSCCPHLPSPTFVLKYSLCIFRGLVHITFIKLVFLLLAILSRSH